jgi:hypothetical protein
MPIGQKVFEIKWKGMTMTIKDVGEGSFTMEMTAQGEFTGFGPAKGLKGSAMTTFLDTFHRSGVSTGTGQGILTTTDGDMVVYRTTFASKMKDGGKQAWIGPVTYMTESKKMEFLNGMVCISEGEGESGSPEGKDTVYEWVP